MFTITTNAPKMFGKVKCRMALDESVLILQIEASIHRANGEIAPPEVPDGESRVFFPDHATHHSNDGRVPDLAFHSADYRVISATIGADLKSIQIILAAGVMQAALRRVNDSTFKIDTKE